MIFSELYGAYYRAVADILAAAGQHPLQKQELRALIEKHAFGESVLNIEPAIREERWQLIRADGSTPIRHAPTMPLTLLEKRWLRAIAADPRARLFAGELPEFPEVEPLFSPGDIAVYDKYADGDPYEDEDYIRRFRLILDAIKNRCPLSLEVVNRNGATVRKVLMPDHLEYSEKDDKFRLIGTGRRRVETVNLARIVCCAPFSGRFDPPAAKAEPPKKRTVEFELYDQRNALERVLMHFAHFEKQAVRADGGKYRVTVYYDRDDETEIVIRLLSFGPMIRVTAPEHCVELIRARLLRQKSCGH